MALFDEVGEMLTGGSTLGALSGFLGEDNDKTSGLLGMAGPALLGALGKRAAAPGGADAVFDLAQNADDGILDNIGGFLGGGDSSGLGSSLVGGLLGSRRGAVESGLAQQSGLGGGIVAKLLPMLAPMVMGMIKRKVMGGGMNAGGLASMLGDNSNAMRQGGLGGILDMLDGGDDEADNAGFLSGMDRFKDIAGIGGATAAAGAVAGKMTGGLGDAAGKVTGGVGDAAGKVGSMAGSATGAVGGAADDFKVKKGGGGMLKWLLPLLLLAALVIIGLWACGGDDGPDVISGADLNGREITVAVENAYLPFNYIDAETGEPGGWDYAAMDDICARLNCTIKWETADWDGMIQAVSNGQYDVAADGITITEDRAQVVDFSDGYINIEQRIIVNKANNDITSSADLAGSDCKVGSQTGTTNYETALKIVGESRIQSFDEFGFAIQALVVNDVCAVIMDETAGQGYVGVNADDLKLVGDSLSSDELGFIFPKGSDLVGPFNKAIAEMKADGTMAELGGEYFSDAFSITYDDIE